MIGQPVELVQQLGQSGGQPVGGVAQQPGAYRVGRVKLVERGQRIDGLAHRGPRPGVDLLGSDSHPPWRRQHGRSGRRVRGQPGLIDPALQLQGGLEGALQRGAGLRPRHAWWLVGQLEVHQFGGDAHLGDGRSEVGQRASGAGVELGRGLVEMSQP